MISFIEFAKLLDSTGYHKARLWKIDAYEIFKNGGQAYFYPDKVGYYKYFVDGVNKTVSWSIYNGTKDEFMADQLIYPEIDCEHDYIQ